MYNYSEKIEYKDLVLDIEIMYTFNSLGKPMYMYHTFFALKDKQVLEDYEDEVIDVVQNYVNDLFENKYYKFAVEA